MKRIANALTCGVMTMFAVGGVVAFLKALFSGGMDTLAILLFIGTVAAVAYDSYNNPHPPRKDSDA